MITFVGVATFKTIAKVAIVANTLVTALCINTDGEGVTYVCTSLTFVNIRTCLTIAREAVFAVTDEAAAIVVAVGIEVTAVITAVALVNIITSYNSISNETSF